ncbi:MAG: acyltransferase [Fimbriimonas sp.]|nr:acyltransferase [Fimbriimonas sp.]
MSDGVIDEASAAAPAKQRDALFDVAKGIGILLVLGHHSFSNSARLYTTPFTPAWWVLSMANRVLSFSVPVFLLISAILSARSLIKNPAVGLFYKRRFPGLLWPYLMWTLIYWVGRMIQDPAARKSATTRLLGHTIHGPAMLLHFRERLNEILWGKAFFHMYFLVVLIGLLLLLPLAVKYVRWRKPGFWEAVLTAFVVQALIMIVQHKTAWVKYPGSNVLWYMGSLLPGAWIGVNWDLFREKFGGLTRPLLAIILVMGTSFLGQEVLQMLGTEADNYLYNGSLTVYASCLSVAMLILAMKLTPIGRWRKLLEPLGKNSLQIYLMHPGIMQVLERPRVASLLNETYLGPLLSPALMLGITFGLIWLMRVAKVERFVFGRTF